MGTPLCENGEPNVQAQERASQIIFNPISKDMSIGKPKNEPIDLNGLMNEIENDHRITVESDAVDKRIEELRVAQRDLRQATEALEKATMTLNEAIAALKSATDSSANIVTGINNAIVNAQENTKFKVSIAQEDVELLMKTHKLF